MNPRDIKLSAKQMLAGVWPLAIAVMVVNSLIEGAGSSIQGIGLVLVSGPLAMGVAGFYLKLARGEEPEFLDMFNGFRHYVNCFVAGLLEYIIVAVFCLLLVVPGIIKSLAYSQTYYILSDHPDMDGWSALKASEEMMKGHKEELFMIWLSFLPWVLACVFVVPIFYFGPYYRAAMTEYYCRLSQEFIIEVEE